MFGNRCQDVNSELVGVRIIGRHKLDTRLLSVATNIPDGLRWPILPKVATFRTWPPWEILATLGMKVDYAYADTLRAKTRMTCVGDQSPPRAVGIRRSLSLAAIARKLERDLGERMAESFDVAPAAFRSAIVGAPAHRWVLAALEDADRSLRPWRTLNGSTRSVIMRADVSWSFDTAR
jgi:hypothetical protein